MRRSFLPIVLVLALVTGVALLRLGQVRTADPASDEDAANLVRRFYDAVNASVLSGRPGDLDRLLAPDLVVHAPPVGLPPTRAGLVRYVLSVRATFPTFQVWAEAVRAAGDVVVVQVGSDGAAPATFLSIPLTGLPAPWGAVDVFRLASGVIVEYWGSQGTFPLLEPLQQAPVEVPGPSVQSLALERGVIAPGGSALIRDASGPYILYVEGGRLAVAITSALGGGAHRWRSPTFGGTGVPDEVAPGSEAALAPGDLFLLPAAVLATIRNPGDASATFLATALRAPGGASAQTPEAARPTTPGGTAADLAGRMMTKLPAGAATLGLGRATLVSGTTLSVHSRGAVLIAIESGSMALAISDGVAWSRNGADGAITTAADGGHGPGDAVLLEAELSGEVRNDGDIPLVLLVLTITPADQ